MNYLDVKPNDEFMQMQLIQYYHLALFYFDTNGDQWVNSTLWLTKDNICTWHGILCDGYQVATAIRLGLNNLRGTIPTEIAELCALEKMFINDSQLFGAIPLKTGAKLNKLKHLNVSNNQQWALGKCAIRVSLFGRANVSRPQSQPTSWESSGENWHV